MLILPVLWGKDVLEVYHMGGGIAEIVVFWILYLLDRASSW